MARLDQLRIRHCTLRICRHGGWSWGADPNRLMQLATDALPSLIAMHLESLLASSSNPVSIGQLSIRVATNLCELSSLPSERSADLNSTTLSKRISTQCQSAFISQTDVNILNSQTTRLNAVETDPSLGACQASSNNCLELLMRWHQHGSLVQLLDHFSIPSLSKWEQAAIITLPNNVASDELAFQCRDLMGRLQEELWQNSSALSFARWRLIMLATLAVNFPGQLARRLAITLLDEFSTVTGTRKEAIERHTLEMANALATPNEMEQSAKNVLQQQVRQHKPKQLDSRPRHDFEVDVSSVLPFVAMGILSRLGYLEVVSLAFQAHESVEELPCLAVALANKMLPSPTCGCYQSDADRRTAAAAAGLRDMIPGCDLERFAVNFTDCLSPADGYLKLQLAEGHDPSYAVLIHQTKHASESIWLATDSQGNFPLGWSSSPDDFLKLLEDYRDNTLLVEQVSAELWLLRALHHRGHRFVTNAPPGRGERWHAIEGSRQLWTNDTEAQTLWLRKQARDLAAQNAIAATLTQALVLDRPSLLVRASHTPVDYVARFEHMLSLAASTALGMLAWKLWGDAEPTDPCLALQRLGNLDGRVTFRSNQVIVRPALGRRYQDLRDHHFLIDVPNLPWLGGRRLVFAGL
ncbi:MAG: hypothetical protein R3C53_06840 [Pirellulaceae bacterium]